MVKEAIDDSAFSTSAVSEACKLAVGVIERVGTDVKRHAGNVCSKIAIKIKMACCDSEHATQKRHCDRREPEIGKPFRQLKTDSPVKIAIENALCFTHFVSGFVSGRLREWRRH